MKFRTADLISRIREELTEAYEDTDYRVPDPHDVIDWALDTVASDTEDRAKDLATCQKVDHCTAEAIVMRAIAEELRAAIGGCTGKAA